VKVGLWFEFGMADHSPKSLISRQPYSISMYVHMYMYVCMYVCMMYVCMYVGTYVVCMHVQCMYIHTTYICKYLESKSGHKVLCFVLWVKEINIWRVQERNKSVKMKRRSISWGKSTFSPVWPFECLETLPFAWQLTVGSSNSNRLLPWSKKENEGI
jgi:hypothetical protein